MIRRAASDEEFLYAWNNFPALTDKDNVEALKIYALWRSYGTKYDFCRFYTADGAIFCTLNGSFVIAETGKCDFEELADFISINGFSDIFCSEAAGKALSEYLCLKSDIVHLMRFEGQAAARETENDTPLEEFYSMLKTSFDIEFEPWYLDMSHRIRHGITRTRRLENSVLVIQHDLFGSALLSQAATVPSGRGKGGASRLLSAVCAELAPSGVYVLCTDELRRFYEKNGFIRIRGKCAISIPR